MKKNEQQLAGHRDANARWYSRNSETIRRRKEVERLRGLGSPPTDQELDARAEKDLDRWRA
jgi:hypothetical protein